jgi:hypothetical protein
MTRLQDRSLYFATDKDLFDLMTSAKKRISIDVILELTRDRGIFLSQENSREDLVNYVCLLPHDYHDLQLLLEQTESPSRKEKTTFATIDENVSMEKLRTAIREVEQERAERCGEVYISSVQDDGHFELEVGYTNVDYGKTRLRQKLFREAKIEFELEENNATIRFPDNDKSREIIDAVVAKLSQSTNESLIPRKIDLSMLTSAQHRTLFFTEMIKCIDGYSLADVTKVDVDRRLTPGLLSSDLDNEDDSDEYTTVESDEMLGIVQRALLQGEGLLQSPEYQSLRDRGFYICNIVWLAQQSTPSGSRVEFSASLSDPETGTGFRYAVRGIYRRKADGNLTKTARPVEVPEQRVLHRLLEAAAWEAVSRAQQIQSEGTIGEES